MRATILSKREKFHVRFFQAALILLLIIPVLGTEGLKMFDFDISYRFVLAPAYLIILFAGYFIGPIKMYYSLTGTIDLDEKQILIRKQSGEEIQVNLEELSSLHFKEEFKKGIDLQDNYFIDLEIVRKDSKLVKQKFYINTKAQKSSLISILESWYKNHYPVKEFMEAGARNFLLKQNLTYNEIQRVKEDYGIDWI